MYFTKAAAPIRVTSHPKPQIHVVSIKKTDILHLPSRAVPNPRLGLGTRLRYCLLLRLVVEFWRRKEVMEPMRQELRDQLAIIYVEKKFTPDMNASMLLKLYDEALKELKSGSKSFRWDFDDD